MPQNLQATNEFRGISETSVPPILFHETSKMFYLKLKNILIIKRKAWRWKDSSMDKALAIQL